MPFPIGFNRTNTRRPTAQEAVRPPAAPPASTSAANVPSTDAPGTHPGFFQRRGPRPSLAPPGAERAGATSLNRRELLAHWNAWANEANPIPTAPGDVPENRQEAVQRMTALLPRGVFHPTRSAGDASHRLLLSNLGLSSLPDHLPPGIQTLVLTANRFTDLPRFLPVTVRSLHMDDNRLTRLPDHLPHHLDSLSVAQNQLAELPTTLAGHLTQLNVSSNQLTQLPETLPATLMRLEASANQLESLPQHLPAALTQLDVAGNQLSHLPASLPDSITFLNVVNNRLTSLPVLPPQLSTMNASHNQLVHIPPHVFSRIAGRSFIVLDNNPVLDESIQRLQEALNAPGLERIQVVFNRAQVARMAQEAQAERLRRDTADVPVAPPQPVANRPERANPTRTARTLGQAASAWARPPQTNIAATFRLWRSFGDEPGARAFAQFLNRLRGTVNFRSPQFQASVTSWLTQLESREQLRRDTFAASVGATESCQDRISLTFNGLRKLHMASDVARGDYDRRLPDLLTLARGMFRLDQLETIANEHTTALERIHGRDHVDPIEVFLAYQVRLREPLALPVETTDMAYFSMSRVTQPDLDRAQARVLTTEQTELVNYLATQFEPWQSVLQRLVPEQHAQAQDELIDAMGDEFTNRLNARLQEMRLQNDPDAQRTLGSQVRAEIAREINGRLTRDFLAQRDLLRLMEPPPSHLVP